MNNRKQIVISTLQNKPVLVYMENEKIYDVLVGEPDRQDALEVGDIYVGRVQNIVANIHAAFVEVKKDKICYLPMSECGDRKIACGDELVVQITKAAVKTKQAVVSMHPETAGRYCVVSTKSPAKSISKKIQDEAERERLQQILDRFSEEEYGIVLRTSAELADSDEIAEECRSMLATMHDRMEHSVYKTCFSLLCKADPFYLNYIRGCPLPEIDRILTDQEEVYRELRPLYGEQVVFYEDETYPLDKLLGISSKLSKAFDRHVWLKSGGSLVIEPTEALTVVDVNTEKAIDGKRNRETTFFKLNCEAAIEAARQIRMRNISGIILIDFMDMKKKEHQQELLELLRTELKKDKTKTVLVDITKLGLVEITRMKKNKPLWEMLDRI